MEHSSIAAALLAAQAEYPTIRKDMTAKGSKFSYDYVSLPALLNAVLPILHKNGVLLTQSVDAGPVLRSVLVHPSSGSSISDNMPLPDNKDMQEYGKTITYARRYQLLCQLGLTDGLDSDANGHDVSTAPIDIPDETFDDIPAATVVAGPLEEARKVFAHIAETQTDPAITAWWDTLRKMDKSSSDKPMSEKQYGYLASLIDKRYEEMDLQHGAILYCLLERRIDREHRPGWKLAGNEKYPGILYSLLEDAEGEWIGMMDSLVLILAQVKEQSK